MNFQTGSARPLPKIIIDGRTSGPLFLFEHNGRGEGAHRPGPARPSVDAVVALTPAHD